MLRFFRNIRKQLMEQKKVRTYIFYAVGEILLVVIGILLALQINTWNQQRNDLASEILYLQNLVSDIDLQLIEYEETLETEIAVGESMLKAGELFEDRIEESEVDSLNIYLSYVIANRSVNSFNATFEDMKSTGNIRLISNEKLKRDILGFYQATERADRVLLKNEVTKAFIREEITENSLGNYQVNYRPTDLSLFLENSGFPAVNPVQDPANQKAFNQTVLNFISSPEGFLKLNNLITNRYFSSMVSIAIINEIKASAEELKQNIEEELEVIQ